MWRQVNQICNPLFFPRLFVRDKETNWFAIETILKPVLVETFKTSYLQLWEVNVPRFRFLDFQ